MKKLFLVAYTRHNASTDAWAYKVDFASEDLSLAKKKYFALLGEYVGGETFDHVSVILYDSNGNKLDSETWQKPIEEPTNNVTE